MLPRIVVAYGSLYYAHIGCARNQPICFRWRDLVSFPTFGPGTAYPRCRPAIRQALPIETHGEGLYRRDQQEDQSAWLTPGLP
jgi:hypothetical protein